MLFSIELKEVEKTYPGGVRALRGVSLTVQPGEVFGLLGPNGAGKTTAVRILSTLSRATAGTAFVAGFDVARQAEEVRRRIGYVAQSIALDYLATGRENLLFHGRLFNLWGSPLRHRIDELVHALQLSDFVDRRVQTYSGGMKRRLDLATGLLHLPKVLFLDEPTAGLDPESRHLLWDQLSSLVSQEGITVLLTTHYMDEADALAHRLAILDQGAIVAQGTPRELKSALEGDIVTVELNSSEEVNQALVLLKALDGITGVVADTTILVAQVSEGPSAIPRIVEALRAHQIPPTRVSLQRPTLDEVYLSATGRKYRPGVGRPVFFRN